MLAGPVQVYSITRSVTCPRFTCRITVGSSCFLLWQNHISLSRGLDILSMFKERTFCFIGPGSLYHYPNSICKSDWIMRDVARQQKHFIFCRQKHIIPLCPPPTFNDDITMAQFGVHNFEKHVSFGLIKEFLG